MTPQEIRKIIDEIKKRERENHGKFKNGQDFRNHFYAKLFQILFTKLGK